MLCRNRLIPEYCFSVSLYETLSLNFCISIIELRVMLPKARVFAGDKHRAQEIICASVCTIMLTFAFVNDRVSSITQPQAGLETAGRNRPQHLLARENQASVELHIR